MRNLELIGEAATHIPEGVRVAHPQSPWRLIIATRNRLIHGYLGIDNDTLWSIITGDIPALHKGVLGAKAQVIAQYGPDSTAVQLPGLKRKSERRPARRAAVAP